MFAAVMVVVGFAIAHEPGVTTRGAAQELLARRTGMEEPARRVPSTNAGDLTLATLAAW